MLEKMVGVKNISLNYAASDWKDAIMHSCQGLIQEEKVTEEYPLNIIKAAEESGPYFVLAPGIALPHARPEEGALVSSLAITTLKTPIEFLQSDNNPVKYVFTLAAADSSNHLEALQELIELFGETEFFELLDTASSAEEVYEYIKKRGK